MLYIKREMLGHVQMDAIDVSARMGTLLLPQCCVSKHVRTKQAPSITKEILGRVLMDVINAAARMGKLLLPEWAQLVSFFFKSALLHDHL